MIIIWSDGVMDYFVSSNITPPRHFSDIPTEFLSQIPSNHLVAKQQSRNISLIL